MHARLTELAEREDRCGALLERFEEAQGERVKALRSAARAREERDEYRRVLAAAIAMERRAEARLETVDGERIAAHERAVEGQRAAAEASAERDALAERVGALEAQVRTQAEAFERSLADVQDRAWTEREASRAELLRIAGEARRGADQVAAEVRASLEETVRAAVAPAARAADPARRIIELRRRLFVGLGLGSIAVGIALVPPAVLSARDATRQAYVHMASGLGAWELIGLCVLAFAAAASFLTLARRDALQCA